MAKIIQYRRHISRPNETPESLPRHLMALSDERDLIYQRYHKLCKEGKGATPIAKQLNEICSQMTKEVNRILIEFAEEMGIIG